MPAVLSTDPGAGRAILSTDPSAGSEILSTDPGAGQDFQYHDNLAAENYRRVSQGQPQLPPEGSPEYQDAMRQQQGLNTPLPPDVANIPESETPGTAALQTIADRLKGLAPTSLKSAAELASPAVGGVETVYDAVRKLHDLYQGQSLQEAFPTGKPYTEYNATDYAKLGAGTAFDTAMAALIHKGTFGEAGKGAVSPEQARAEPTSPVAASDVQKGVAPRINPDIVESNSPSTPGKSIASDSSGVETGEGSATTVAEPGPWQLTQGQYGEQVLAAGPDFSRRMSPHRQIVENAIAEVKPVSPEVLADYPDLTQTSEPAKVTIPDEELNPRTDIRSANEGLQAGELAQVEQQRPLEEAGVSTKNQYTEGRRDVLGMEPAEETVPRSDQDVQDKADLLLRGNPDAGQNLVEELGNKPRPITDAENAVLSRHIADLERQHSDLVEHINKTGDEGATDQLNTVRDNLQSAFDAAKGAGTELGRGLRQRQVEEAAQYTLPKMEAERRAVNGGKQLSPDQLKQVEGVFKRMQDAQSKLGVREKAISDGRVPSRPRGGVSRFLDKQAEAARQRIIERRGRLNVGFDPTALSDEIIIGASHIARGVRNFDAWSTKMLQDFGDRVKPYLRELYERAIQTRNEAAKSTKESFRPTGSTAEAVKDFQRQDQYRTATIKKTEELKSKTVEGDVSKTSRSSIVLDPISQKFRAEYEKAKYDYNVMLEKDRLSNRPMLKKVIDKAVDAERAIKLTGIKTFGKLGSAGIMRVGQTAAEEAVGKAMSLAPVLRKVMQSAPTEGTPTLRSAGAYVKGAVQGVKEIPGVISGRIATRDIREGGTPRVPSLLDIPGRLHGAVKQPFKKAQEGMALQKALDVAKRQGTIEKPGVIETAQKQAQESGLRAIMTNDNVLSNGWNNFVGALEGNKKFPTAGYAAAKVMRFLLPIVRVPTNIAIEAGTMSTGAISGSAKLMQVMARGMETIKPEEADMIARHLKKGAVGAGLFLYGYFNADKFGGLYQAYNTKNSDKINRNGMQSGQAKFGAMTIPDWLLSHSPAGLQMQFGATVKKYMDTGKSAPVSAMAGAQEIVHEVPFVNEMSRIDSLLKSNWEGQSARGNLVKGSVVPQGLSNVAEWMDKGQKRSPKTIEDYIKSGVPGLREQVPLSKHQ